jgi:hypothetical protein
MLPANERRYGMHQVTVLVSSGIEPEDMVEMGVPEKYLQHAKLAFLRQFGYSLEKKFSQETSSSIGPRVVAHFGALRGGSFSDSILLLTPEECFILAELQEEFRQAVLEKLGEFVPQFLKRVAILQGNPS